MCRCNIELWWCGPNSQFRLGIFVWLPESSLLRALERVRVAHGWPQAFTGSGWNIKYAPQSQSIFSLLSPVKDVLSMENSPHSTVTLDRSKRLQDSPNLCWWWQHHYILPLTVSKRDHISVHQLYISAGIYQLAVELRAIRAL